MKIVLLSAFLVLKKREEEFEKNIKFRKGAQKGWEQVFLSYIRAECVPHSPPRGGSFALISLPFSFLLS